MEEQEQPIRTIRKSDGEIINVYFEPQEPVRPICKDVELINPEHPPAYLRRDILDEKGEVVATFLSAPAFRMADTEGWDSDNLYDMDTIEAPQCQGISTMPLEYSLHAQNIKIEFAESGLIEALNAVDIAFCNLADAAAAALHYAFSTFQRALDEFDVMAYDPGDLRNRYSTENRHDGARRPPVPQLIPARTLHELYGQGVDHGGPGLPRLTLIRVTDDWPMEGRNGILPKRRQRNETMQRLRPGGNRRH